MEPGLTPRAAWLVCELGLKFPKLQNEQVRPHFLSPDLRANDQLIHLFLFFFNLTYFNCDKIYIKFTISTIFKCIQFNSMKCIHIVEQPSSIIIHSSPERFWSPCEMEPLHPLNISSPFPSPSPWQSPLSFLWIWLPLVPHINGIQHYLSFRDWLT